MMPMLIHPKNIGRSLRLKDGRTDKICHVLASKEGFRVSSEALGPVVSDYSFEDIQEAKGLVVSQDGGVSWMQIDVKKL